jgi:hypothetical protein
MFKPLLLHADNFGQPHNPHALLVGRFCRFRSAAVSALQQAQNTQRSRVRAWVEHVC